MWPSGGVAAVVSAVLLTASSALAAEPLAFVPASSDNYAETVTFVGDFDGQHYVQVQLSLTNIGPGRENGVCRFLVTGAGSRPWTANERFNAKEWSYTAGDQRLQIGTCSASVAGEKTLVKAALPAGTVELTFDAPPKLHAPPNNVIEHEKSKHVTWLLHLATPVTALITPKGKPAYTLKGFGYADHSRTDVSAAKLARRWIRFRALGGAQSLFLLGRETPAGTFGPLWLWPKGQSAQSLTSFTAERTGEKKRPSFEISVTGPNGVATLRSNKLLFRHAPVEELGIVGRAVKPFVGSPVTYTYRGSLVRPGADSVEGILEVSVDSE